MVLQKLWVSQNFSRISRVSLSRFLAVMCVPQSRFLDKAVSESRFFAKLKGFKVPIRSFISGFINDVFSSLDIEFQ